MQRDRFGQSLSTDSPQAAECYDAAVDRLFAMQPGAEALIDEALRHDEHFALAWCTKARSAMTNGRAADARRYASRAVDLARELPAGSGRERRYAEIVRKVLHGESKAALDAVVEHVGDHPRDAVPLSFALGVYGLLGFGGYSDFTSRQVALLRSVSGAWGDDWWFLASRGWALVEDGASALGIDMLERSLELHPENANAAHGRAHGFYEQGAAAEGEAFLAGWLPGYPRSAPLHGHLAWHHALFALQRGDAGRALAIYRDAVAPDASEALPMFTLIDCAAFLMRCDMLGAAVQEADRRQLSALAEEHFGKPGVPFLNLHLAFVHAVAGDEAALRGHRRAVAALLADGAQPSGAVVVDLCNAVLEFHAGNYRAAGRLLEQSRADHARLGGSGAQRDVLVDLAACAYLRAGDGASAQRTAAARSARRAGHLNSDWLEMLA